MVHIEIPTNQKYAYVVRDREKNTISFGIPTNTTEENCMLILKHVKQIFQTNDSLEKRKEKIEKYLQKAF